MAILAFLIQLLSGAILLLFSVNFMRVGIERLWSSRIKESLSGTPKKGSLIGKGAALGFTMQGATVVMLMAASMAAGGTIPLLSAVMIAIGADFGSAVAVRFLSLPVSALGPLLILAGGWAYLYGGTGRSRNFGRFVLGLGLVFLSLATIRAAVAPIQGLTQGSGALGYFNADPVTAALAGLALTFLMHSSLAAILTAMAVAANGALGPIAALAFVFGCNLGSAILPIWLLRNDAPATRAVAKTVAILRSAMAALLIAGLALIVPRHLGLDGIPVPDVILFGHLGFNFALMFTAPFAGMILRNFAIGSDASEQPQAPGLGIVPQEPHMMLAAMKGQVNRMLDLLSGMADLVTGPVPDTKSVKTLETRMNGALSELRLAYSKQPDLDEDTGKTLEMTMEYAIRIERCADILSGKYLRLRVKEVDGEFRFSDEGKQEIDALFQEIRKTILLAQTVFWTQAQDRAAELVQQKQHVSMLEENSRRQHLRRVGTGNLNSLGSSDFHLEMTAALKEINSKLATIGYAVLEQRGALRSTRLKAKPKDLATS